MLTKKLQAALCGDAQAIQEIYTVACKATVGIDRPFHAAGRLRQARGKED